MAMLNNPRSTLHALEAMGHGTGDIESLTSYFCRLAHSHGMTARNLAVWVLEHVGESIPGDYKWFRRSFSGMSQESEQWSVWLAELTGVGALNKLTLTPWRHLISNPGLAPVSDRWCPCCLRDDKVGGNSPYLRLAWDIGPVTVCHHHKVELLSSCPHCGKSNVRNRASVVVPGYCTACGGFLGDGESAPAKPEALWLARQVGHMLACSPTVSSDGVGSLLEVVIERMAAGNVAAFAKKLGLSKSGVWHWVNKGGQPTLLAWLAISLHGGIGLEKLLAGDVYDWVLPSEPVQMPMPFTSSPRKGIKSRQLDWNAIRGQLEAFLEEPEPITLGEACQRVGVEYKHLYLQATTEARAIADRFRRHQASTRQERAARLSDRVSEVLHERQSAGYKGLSARDVLPLLDGEMKVLRNIYHRIGAVVAAND